MNAFDLRAITRSSCEAPSSSSLRILLAVFGFFSKDRAKHNLTMRRGRTRVGFIRSCQINTLTLIKNIVPTTQQQQQH
jgi:hypothetical protein